MVYWRQLVYNTRVNTRLLQQGAQPQEDWLQKQGYCVLPQTQAPQILTDTHQALHVGTKPLYHLWRPLILRPLLAPLTWWTWVWASSRSWWWTEKPGVLQSMGSQRVGHSWETELNWAEPRVTVTQLSHSKMIVLITHPHSFPLEAQSSNIYVLTHSLELDMEQQTGSK